MYRGKSFFNTNLTYCIRMQGMLMQLAAPTATRGTRRPKSGFMFFTAWFRERAVTRAPLVAKQYEVTSCLNRGRNR